MINNYDCVIIGGGPAGLTAAMYLLRANKNTLILNSGETALEKASLIENYFGAGKISGAELQRRGEQQVQSFGGEIRAGQVLSLECGINGEPHKIRPESGGVISARAVIIATGASRKTLSIPGLARLEGAGVSYCAVCDAFFYRGKDLFVLGGGAYALHEADVLKNTAKSVTLLTNGETDLRDLQAACEFPVITTPIASLEGDKQLERIIFKDGTETAATGLFVALGVASGSDLARSAGLALETDEPQSASHIAANAKAETNVPGVYAAGDCTGAPYQIAVAVGEGAAAGLSALQYINRKPRE